MRAVRGFTLIELLACLAILSVLAAAAMPVAELTAQRQRERELRQALWEIRAALDAYRRAADEGRIVPRPTRSGYPATLEALVEGADDARSPTSGQRIHFLRRVPRDPFHPDGRVPAEKTWLLRSYAAPASRPQPGDDVYDVYSASDRTGLNGVPYRLW